MRSLFTHFGARDPSGADTVGFDDPGRDPGRHQQDEHHRQRDALGRTHVDQHVIQPGTQVVEDQAEEGDDHQRFHESTPVAVSAAVEEGGRTRRRRSQRQRTTRATVITPRNRPYDTELASTCCHMWPNERSALAMLQYMPAAAAVTASSRLVESNSVRAQPRGARGYFQYSTARIVNQGRNRISARFSSTCGFMGAATGNGE